jgi:hypothetical protein
MTRERNCHVRVRTPSRGIPACELAELHAGQASHQDKSQGSCANGSTRSPEPRRRTAGCGRISAIPSLEAPAGEMGCGFPHESGE